MASKTGEDCAVQSDDEKSDEENDNYNIYEWYHFQLTVKFKLKRFF